MNFAETLMIVFLINCERSSHQRKKKTDIHNSMSDRDSGTNLKKNF